MQSSFPAAPACKYRNVKVGFQRLPPISGVRSSIALYSFFTFFLYSAISISGKTVAKFCSAGLKHNTSTPFAKTPYFNMESPSFCLTAPFIVECFFYRALFLSSTFSVKCFYCRVLSIKIFSKSVFYRLLSIKFFSKSVFYRALFLMVNILHVNLATLVPTSSVSCTS